MCAPEAIMPPSARMSAVASPGEGGVWAWWRADLEQGAGSGVPQARHQRIVVAENVGKRHIRQRGLHARPLSVCAIELCVWDSAG